PPARTRLSRRLERPAPDRELAAAAERHLVAQEHRPALQHRLAVDEHVADRCEPVEAEDDLLAILRHDLRKRRPKRPFLRVDVTGRLVAIPAIDRHRLAAADSPAASS